MDNTLASLITLTGLLIPGFIFIQQTPSRNAAGIIHALLMALICLFMGLLFSAAMITLAAIESQLLTSTLVLFGSLLAMLARLYWIKRFG